MRRTERRQAVWKRLARRDILAGLLGFLGIQWTLAAAIDGPWVSVRDPEFAAKLQGLTVFRSATAGRPLVLVLGTSRTHHGLQPSRLSEAGPAVYNFGLPGAGSAVQQVVLRRLVAAGIRPDRLVVEVIPFALARDPAGRPVEDRWLRPYRFRRDEFDLATTYLTPGRHRREWWLARALPLWFHQAELRAALTSGAADEDWTGRMVPDGYVPGMELNSAQRRDHLRLTLEQYAACCRATTLHPKSERAVADLLSLAAAQGIPTTVLHMPEASELRAVYSPELRTAIAGSLDRLRLQYGAAVIDAGDWVGDEGFWDGHHLKAAGAAAFTDRFRRDGLPIVVHPPAGAP